MATIQVSGVNPDLLSDVASYANQHDLSDAEAWRELARRGLKAEMTNA